MKVSVYLRSIQITLVLIAICFLLTNAAFGIDEYDPEIMLQVPHKNILNNESLPGTAGNTGALSFSIPIKVPPGQGGLQPELSLTYNSNSRQKNWLGVGWSLDMGFIQRSSKKPIKFNYEDSFAYNGTVDLVKMPGFFNQQDYYSARVEGEFSKFQYNGENSGWVVHKADGEKYYYGTNPASQIEFPRDFWSSNAVYKWLLDKIEDANGNTITITYTNDYINNGERYLEQISYAPSGSRIDFITESRTQSSNDTYPVFNNYKEFNYAELLKEIRVYGSGAQAYKYLFNYEEGHYGRSMLTNVKEYGSDFVNTVFPETRFEYEPGVPFSFEPTKISNNISIRNVNGRTHFGDVNGDGFTDMLKIEDFNAYIYLGNNSGNFGSPIVTPLGIFTMIGYTHLSDVNGDGRSDLIINRYYMGSSMRVYLASSTQEGTFNYSGANERIYSSASGIKMVDANGDGLPDLVELNGSGFGSIDVHISDGSGDFELTIITTTVDEGGFSSNNSFMSDCNGDGLADVIIFSGAQATVYLANGNGTYGVENAGSCNIGNINTPCNAGVETTLDAIPLAGLVHFADVNGDSFSDIVFAPLYIFVPDHERKTLTYFSDGKGGFVKAAEEAFTTEIYAQKGYMAVDDINGDGLADLVKKGRNYPYPIHYYIGNGNGGYTHTGSFSAIDDGFLYLTDVNGDKLADVLTIEKNAYTVGAHLAKTMSPSQIPPDLLVNIDNGYGVSSTINYKLSNRYPLAQKPSGSYPNTHLPFITKFVNSIVVNDGIGNTSITTNYDYFGARFNSKEKEFFGLERIVQTNPNNTTWAATYNVDNYYLKGLLSTSTYADNLSSDRNETVYDWDESVILNDVQDNAQKEVVWVRSNTVNSNIISGGTSVTSNLTNGYLYNSSGFGYTSSITKSGTGASSHIETNTYANQSMWNWQLTNNSIQQGGTTARQNTFTYDGAGNLKVETHANNIGANAVILRNFDGYGNVISETDPNSNTTILTYQSGTHLSSKSFGGLTTTYSNFNQFGQPRQVRDENSNDTVFTYDGYGRITKEDYPGAGYKDIVYNDTARPRYTINRVYDGSGTLADTYAYRDGLDRPLQTTQRGLAGENITAVNAYDGAGRKWNTTGPFFTSNFAYPASSPSDAPFNKITSFDFLDRPKTIQTPHDDGSIANTIISYPGFNRIIRDPDGHPTTEGRDFLGRIQTITEANGVSTSYDYNAAGDLTQVTGPLNNSIVLTRNWLGQITQQNDPDLGVQNYTYKPNGEIETQEDVKEQKITYGYDNLNRLTSKTFTATGSTVPIEPPVVLTYDAAVNGAGKLYSVTKDGVIIIHAAYTETGQLEEKKIRIDGQDYTTNYTYNPAGSLDGIVYPDLYSVDYTFHPGTALIASITATNPDINVTIPSHSAFGKIKRIQYPGFASTFNYFNRTGRLNSVLIPNLMEFDYNYSYAGDVLTKYDDIRNLSYVYDYDNLHRLTEESAVGPFSGQENRTIDMYYESAAPHAANRVSTTQGKRTNIYDPNGNLTTGYDFKTPGLFPERRISYNTENMPTTIAYEPEGGAIVSVNYTYDGNGQRVKKQAGSDVVKYIDTIYEIRNEQPTKFIFAGNLRIAKIKGSDVQYYHKDHLGSSSVMSDENGILAESIAYEPYGSQRKLFCAQEQSDTNYTFTDQEWDAETGLYNYDARLYDPILGRFISADSIVPNWHDPQLLDRYAYVRNNPVKYVDPDGHFLGLAVVGSLAIWGVLEHFINPNEAAAPTNTQDQQNAKKSTSGLGNAVTASTMGVSVTGVLIKGGIKKGLIQLGKEVVEETTGVSTNVVSKKVDKWSRLPKSIQDQMTLDAAKKGAGKEIIKNLGNPKFKGMSKWEYKVKSSNGKDSVVHYVKDPKTRKRVDFKFKKHSKD